MVFYNFVSTIQTNLNSLILINLFLFAFRSILTQLFPSFGGVSEGRGGCNVEQQMGSFQDDKIVDFGL